MRLTLVLVPILCTAQVAPEPKLRANRNTYHPAIEVLRPKFVSAIDAQLEQLRKLPLEAIWGLKSSRPQEKLVGRALTIRYLPKRPDLVEAMETLAKEGGWHVRAAEEVKPRDVLVGDLGGDIDTGVFWGDISALAAKTAGARGAILYGSSRDLTELRDIESFPVMAVGFDPRPAIQIGVDWNVPIRVGPATVLPGMSWWRMRKRRFSSPPVLSKECWNRLHASWNRRIMSVSSCAGNLTVSAMCIH